jgi:hypothetical protein
LRVPSARAAQSPIAARKSRARRRAEWHALAARFPGRQGYLYGTGVRGLVYTYDAATDALSVELALVDGVVRP